jgi:rhodanese-related sulfurtransferase
MPTAIFKDAVRQLLEDGAQLVDVLPQAEYEEEHLPGAINIPLKELNRQTSARLRHDVPVIVYCHDYQ